MPGHYIKIENIALVLALWVGLYGWRLYKRRGKLDVWHIAEAVLAVIAVAVVLLVLYKK